MLAGMAGVSGPDLVAGVSNAGGIGTIGAIGLSPEDLRQAVRRTRKLTSKPMGSICCYLKLEECAKDKQGLHGGQLAPGDDG